MTTPHEVLARHLHGCEALGAEEGSNVLLEALSRAGYVVVPREPTDAMHEAAWSFSEYRETRALFWRSMVEAATEGQ